MYFMGLCLLISSCSDSFLDLAPKNEASVENFYRTPEEFNTAVVSCYSKLQSQIGYYTDMIEYRSDNLFLSAPTASTQDRFDIDHFNETPSNGILSSLWANFYNNIFRCNLVLDKIADKTFSETLRRQYIGEAKFIRALTYFNLYRAWGGVPVTLKVVSPKEGLTIGRSTPEEMYEVIVNDLQDAITHLPGKNGYQASDLGRATSDAARALLGKVYLTFGKTEQAKSTLAELIDKYNLLSDPADVFDVNKEMNAEILFAIRFSKNVVDEGHGLWYSTPDLNVTMISPGLIDSYDNTDRRKKLLEYAKSGNAYVIKKYYDELNITTKNVGNDFIVLRYADVLLMYAEALNEISYNNDQNSAAFKALNEVHQRAGLTALKPLDLPDQTAFRKAILDERRKEFPLEGQRWFDLIRLKAVNEEMNKVNLFPAAFRNIYPIPKTELERINNTAILYQNPGYN